MAWSLGGEVVPCEHREYGHANLSVEVAGNPLFADVPAEISVWMSHGDQLRKVPDGFHVIAKTPTAPLAAVQNTERHFYGLQFHPEVTHTPQGTQLLRNFVTGICGCQTSWTMSSFIDKEIDRIRNLVGPTAQVIGAVSGGVDSTVAAALMNKAIGDRSVWSSYFLFDFDPILPFGLEDSMPFSSITVLCV